MTHASLVDVPDAGGTSASGIRPKSRINLEMCVSRLLDRLEAAGYVQRRPCDDDGRGQTVTDQGRAMRRRMWPVYGAAMQSAVRAKLDSAEAQQLAALLDKLVRERN